MQEIKLNLIPSGISETVYLNQFDIGQPFKIFLQDGIRQAALSGVPTVKINGRKGDDHIFIYTENDTYDDIEGSGHYIITKELENGGLKDIIIRTSQQMTAAAGDTLAQLVLTLAGVECGTLNFVMRIQEQPGANGDTSGSDLPDIIAMATAQMLAAQAAAVESRSWAEGGTNTRQGEDTDNAEYWAGQAASSANLAASSETNAGTSERNAAASEAAARAAAEQAAAAELNPPYIDRITGHWMVYDTSTSQYVDSGVDADISITIDGITMLDPSANPSVTDSGQAYDHIYHFNIPRGKGIQSIEKTATSGLVDTYTITYSDGYTATFTVTNGKTAYQSAVEGGYSGTEAQFENDLAHFGTWATEASSSATSAANSEATATQKAKLSESWAVGGTSTRTGEDTNNAKFWSDTAQQYAGLTLPTFIIDGNKLYVDDGTQPDWKVENNRLYVKLV